MEKFWNYIHINIYLFEKYVSALITYPIEMMFDLFYKLPIISKGLEKRGVSRKELKKTTDNVMNNLDYGQNITIASIQMGGLLVLIEYSLFNFLQAILGRMLIQYIWEDVVYKLLFVFGSLVIPSIINYYSLWKNDKYLDYFKNFEKESKSTRIKWSLISIVVIIGILLLLIFSFWLLSVVVYQS